MADDDLAAIRAKRLAELEAQYGVRASPVLNITHPLRLMIGEAPTGAKSGRRQEKVFKLGLIL